MSIPKGLVTICALAFANSCAAHGGGLDADGCHTNRKTGEYHCHRGGLRQVRMPDLRLTRTPPSPRRRHSNRRLVRIRRVAMSVPRRHIHNHQERAQELFGVLMLTSTFLFSSCLPSNRAPVIPDVVAIPLDVPSGDRQFGRR